jgi:hypothetical protein
MMASSRRILAIDPSKELALLLGFTLRGSEFTLDPVGSYLAGLHRIREGNNFLLLWENHRNPEPRGVVHILREAQKASLPMILISSWHLPEENRKKLSVLVDLVEPPLYPYRLYREFKLFEAIEDTVYVFRNPERRLKGVHFWFLDITEGEGEEVLKIFREYAQELMVRFLATEHLTSALSLISSQKHGILFLFARDPQKAQEAFLKVRPEIGQGGVVLLLPEEVCSLAPLYPLLALEPLAILPWNFLPQDLDFFTSSLRQQF